MSDIDISYQLQLLSYSICKVVCISVLKNLYKKNIILLYSCNLWLSLHNILHKIKRCVVKAESCVPLRRSTLLCDFPSWHSTYIDQLSPLLMNTCGDLLLQTVRLKESSRACDLT